MPEVHKPTASVQPRADSLPPGASVWPQKMATPRTVSLSLAVVGATTCLVVGFLAGFVFAGSRSSPGAERAVARLGEVVAASQAVTSELMALAEQEAQSDDSSENAVRVVDEDDPSVPDVASARGSKGSTQRSRPSSPEGESGSPAGRLSSGLIQRTVHRYQPSVRHGCWQRQLSQRGPTAPGSARVAVTLTISPDGRVSSVATSGDPPGYPGLAGCIASKVKTWTFPKAGDSTTAQIPFTFAVQ